MNISTMATANVGGEESDRIYNDIISGMAVSIKNGDPVEEIRDMIIDNGKFKECIKKWKDKSTSMNILQIAVLKGEASTVNLLNELSYDYDTYIDSGRQPKNEDDIIHILNRRHRRNHLGREPPLNNMSGILKPRFTVNSPLHLACKTGNLDVVKLFADEDDLELVNVLDEPSLLTVECFCEDVSTSSSEGNKLDNVGTTSEQCIAGEQRTTLEQSTREQSRLNTMSERDKRMEQRRKRLEPTSGKSISKVSLAKVTTPLNKDLLIRTCNFNGETSATGNERETSTPMHTNNGSETVDGSDIKGIGKTPLEICIAEKHVKCALYIANLVYRFNRTDFFVDFKQNRQFQFYPLQPQPNSGLLSREKWGKVKLPVPDMKNKSYTPLHIACFLKSPELLELLIQNGYSEYLNANGSPGMLPPLFAALHKSAECVEILLKYGAKTNCMVYHQNALLWLFEDLGCSTSNTALVKNTELLIKEGVNVNIKDMNSNTPLDYLASDYAKTLNYYRTSAASDIAGDEKENALQTCAKLLLENGAKTMVLTGESKRISHTIGHTLLLNSSWPVTAYMVKHSDSVYRMFELLFQYGLDPNVLPTHNPTNLLAQLICNSLGALQVEAQKKYMLMFIMNRACLNSIIPPTQAMEGSPIRIWNVYPLILALQERIPATVLAIMCDYMSIGAVNECILSMAEGHLWSRIQMLRSSAPPGTITTVDGVIAKYKTSWDILAKPLTLQTRSLKHFCKLKILGSLCRRGSLVECLHLPNLLKQYLVQCEC